MLLILDGNNLAWAGYYGLERAMKPGDDEERKHRVALLGLSGTALGSIARRGEPPGVPPQNDLTGVAICFDEGRPLRRRQIFAPYQTGREGDPKFVTNEPTILRAVAEFCEMCKMLPVRVLRGANTEADDLIAGVVRATKDPVRIVSTDRDFLQLIDGHASVYSPVKKIIVDHDNLMEAAAPRTSSGATVEFPRERFLDYRAMVGDPSDNIPGVPGAGPLTAAKLLQSASIATYFGRPERVRQALARKSAALESAFADGTAEAIHSRNRTLMDLRLPAPCWDTLDEMTTTGTWDRAGFEAWAEEQRFSGLDVPLLLSTLDALASRQH